MNLTLDIRTATLADVEIIVEYNRLLAAETEQMTLSAETLQAGVAALFEDPSRGRYYLACRSGAVVGQMMITTEWSDWRNGDIWWIQSVYVLPDHRGSGVYRALHEHVKRLSEQSTRVVGLRLYVKEDNHRARQTYARLGMRPAGYLVMQDL